MEPGGHLVMLITSLIIERQGNIDEQRGERKQQTTSFLRTPLEYAMMYRTQIRLIN